MIEQGWKICAPLQTAADIIISGRNDSLSPTRRLAKLLWSIHFSPLLLVTLPGTSLTLPRTGFPIYQHYFWTLGIIHVKPHPIQSLFWLDFYFSDIWLGRGSKLDFRYRNSHWMCEWLTLFNRMFISKNLHDKKQLKQVSQTVESQTFLPIAENFVCF